jgi:hypothetical protein
VIDGPAVNEQSRLSAGGMDVFDKYPDASFRLDAIQMNPSSGSFGSFLERMPGEQR